MFSHKYCNIKLLFVTQHHMASPDNANTALFREVETEILCVIYIFFSVSKNLENPDLRD
jgi:hypothetical protein